MDGHGMFYPSLKRDRDVDDPYRVVIEYVSYVTLPHALSDHFQRTSNRGNCLEAPRSCVGHPVYSHGTHLRRTGSQAILRVLLGCPHLLLCVSLLHPLDHRASLTASSAFLIMTTLHAAEPG